MSQFTGFFRNDTGQRSMMRLLSFLGFILGAGIAGAGVVGWAKGLPDALGMVLAGLGIASGSELGKVLQKKLETK